jgi:hypothetical protein
MIMTGVTGRMGIRQHLVRSVAAIREQGGIPLPGGETLVPDPVLVGRNEKKLRSLAEFEPALPTPEKEPGLA